MSPRARSALILAAAAALAACGGKATDQTATEGGPSTPQGSDAPARPAVTSPDEGDDTRPALVADVGSPPDPIFDDPDLTPGITTLVQPSYFSDPTDAPPVGITAVDGGDMALSGTGDLTVLLVFDKSSSMLLDWDGKSRWQVANESLRSALDGILDVLTIGVIRFPLGESCGVPELDGGSQIGYTTGRRFVAIWQSMEHRLESLGTPLFEALSVADRAIAQAASQGRLEGRFRVVLVTDGEPNCGGHVDSMTALVAGWYAEGIETLVIGLPGSSSGAFVLDALAQAGGTGAVTMTATEDELGGELNQALR